MTFVLAKVETGNILIRMFQFLLSIISLMLLTDLQLYFMVSSEKLSNIKCNEVI